MITLKEYLEAYHKYPFFADKEYETKEKDKNTIREYNKMLIEKYPWLEPRNRWSGKRISECANGEKGYWPGNPDELPEWDWSHTELDDMPEGWRIAFGEQLCEELQSELKKFNYDKKYTITQIKEKYGYLHWYDNGIPVGSLSDDYETIISDDWNNFDHDNYHYEYIGKSDDKNNTNMYKRKKILEKCKVWDIIHKYENLSETTCIKCGKPAKYMSKGWISPFCEECATQIAEGRDIKKEFDIIEENDN